VLRFYTCRASPRITLHETPWQSKTPSNTHEFGSQSKLVSNSFIRSPVTAQAGFSQLVKGAELMLHQNELLAARNSELEEQLAIITQRKARKRKQIQLGGTMEYWEGAAKVAAKDSIASKRSKKTCGGGDQERAHPGLRRGGNCGGTGHKARTCRNGVQISCDLDASTTFVGSLSDGDKIEDA
jgi:hypothetical protein